MILVIADSFICIQSFALYKLPRMQGLGRCFPELGPSKPECLVVANFSQDWVSVFLTLS